MSSVTTVMVGTAVLATATFINVDGAPFDPALVRFKWRTPDGTESAWYVYGTDAEVQRESLGVFFMWFPSTQAGEHCVRVETSGAEKVAAETQFEVDPSCFAVT